MHSTGISFWKGLERHKSKSVLCFGVIGHGMAIGHRGSVKGTPFHGNHCKAFW